MAEGIPLLTLHGGPGFPHDYMESLEGLADRRRVIFYDQLGCGRSDRPDDNSLWTVRVEGCRELLEELPEWNQGRRPRLDGVLS